MVAIVAGNGLGLFNTALNSLGGAGQGSLGQAGGQALVNISNGNLILRFTDEQLSGLGLDLLHTRTYNTQGGLSDGDADGWRWDGERSLALIGTLNTPGSQLVRTTGDGHRSVYQWNGSRYQSSEGDGAHDFVTWDAANGLAIWTDGSRRTVERYSGSNGRLLSVTDANGTQISYGYDAAGRLSSVKDRSGQEMVLNYNAAGKLERLDTRTNSAGALTQQVYYTYDALGRLASVSTDLSPDDNSIADGNVYSTQYSYFGSTFYMASVTQSDGTSVSFGYVQVGSEYRISSVTDGSGTTGFSYDTTTRRTDVLNDLGQQWSYFYDAQDRLIEVQTPAVNGQRQSTRYAYDAYGQVTQITDGRGNTVIYLYDANGNRVLERDSQGTTIARTYNADNQLLNEIRYRSAAVWNSSTSTWNEPPASSAQVTRYSYDNDNRVRFVVDGRGQVTEFRYNSQGLKVQEISYGDALFALAGLANEEAVSESVLSNWTAARDKSRSTLTELSYDYRGNLSRRVTYALVDASGAGVLDAATSINEYVYSQYGQLLQTLTVRGAERNQKTTLSSVVYDGLGRMISQTDASGTRTLAYTGSGRTVAVTNSTGLTLTQAYDGLGRLVSLTQSAANTTPRVTLYVYDVAGRQTMVQDPTGVRSYTLYDEAGRVSAQVDGTGAVVEYLYNEAGQRIEERRYATLIDTTGAYNGSTVVVTAVAQIRPGANAADRITRYSYDAAGRLSSTINAAGVVTTFTYDGLGQLVQQQIADRSVRYFYDASGHQSGQLDAEGYLRENRYDALGRLVQSIRYANATAVGSRASGSLDQLRPPAGDDLSSWYYYDAAGRLIGSVDDKQFFTETLYDEATNSQVSYRYASAYSAGVTGETSLASLKAAVQGGARQSSSIAFDDQGRVARRVATDGTVTAYEYDAGGRLVRETTAQGTSEERSTRTLYDAFGQSIGKLLGEASVRITTGMSEAEVAAVYAQYGLTYQYDAAGRVASVRDALGNRTLSYYDAAGRLTQVINALGEVSEVRYNAFGQVSEQTRFSARLASGDLAVLSGGLLTQPVALLARAIRNAASDNTSQTRYNLLGLKELSVDALGNQIRYAYNEFGEQIVSLRSSVDGTSIRESLVYNKRGELTTRVEDVGGLARTTQSAYDAFGRVIRRMDGRGQLSTITYADSGRSIVTRDGLNQSQFTEYDAFDRVLKQVDALGQTTLYRYNDTARSLTVTTADGVSVTTVKNRHGQTLRVTDGQGNTNTYGYDKNGQLLSTSDALGRITTQAYDAGGNLLSVTDALGRVIRYGYDAVNRTVSRTDAYNSVTRYSFDGQGRKVRQVEAEGLSSQRITDYSYDRLGQMLTVVQDPNGLKLQTSYTYDGFGNQIQVARGTQANPNQQVVLYIYDHLGRRTAERLEPNGANLTTQYRYNGNDQVTRKIDPAGNSTWYIYDNAGRLTDTIDALGGVSRNTYDAAGHLTSTTRFANALAPTVLAGLGDAVLSVAVSINGSKDQTTAYIYDAVGKVHYSINALNQVSENRYDANGLIVESRQYDKAIAANTPRTLADTAAALEAAGAHARITRSTYDAAGQLSSVTDALGKTESYTYDAVGNRLTLTNKNGAVWNYRYDNLNRLLEEITPAVSVASLDANGVLSSKTVLQVSSFTYDALGNISSRTQGRLRSSLQADPAMDDLSQARTTSYGYDALGRQVQITSPGWYNKASGAYQQSSDGTANTFQVTTEVTYDVLGNAVRNRVRVNNSGAASNDFVDSYKVYDSLGRLTHDIDALKGVTAYTYDAQGNRLTTKRYANALTAAQPAVGYYSSSDLSGASLLASPGQDRTLTTRYDALGRKVAVQQDLVNLYNFTGSVSTSGLIKAAPTTLYSYNALGQLVREVQVARDAGGATVMSGANSVYYYDQAGNRIGSVDALGNYTRMEYDSQGKLSRQVEYANGLSSWDENTLPGNPLASVDDRSTRYDYDAMGRLIQVTQEGVRYWQQSINAQGVVSASAIVGNQVVSRVSYDGVGNTRTVTDAMGNVTTTDYNALGQVSQITEPARITARNGAVDPFAAGTVLASPITTYAVNAFGQVLSETRSAGRDASNQLQAGLSQTKRSRYDAAGYEVQSFDAAGVATAYKVDVAGRRLEQSLQTSIVLSGWTSAGSALSRTQTLRRSFTYDALGQQLSTSDWYTAADNTQKSTTQSAQYNRFGEVSSQLLNGNLQASYQYDQAGRAIQQQNAQGISQFDYDLNGKASRSNQIGDVGISTDDRITYTRYDVLGRALEQHLPAFEANLNSDTLNNINLTLATPIIRQTYDRWGNTLSRTDPRGYITRYSFDHNNRQLTETLPVTDILRENGTSYRASLIHEKRYDALGQLIQETDLVGPYAGMLGNTELRTRQHLYNQAGELLRDIDALGYSRNYLVDIHGNRVASQDALGTVLVDSYDALDRQLTHGIVRNGAAVTLLTNQYDQAGRLVGEISGSTAVEETLVSTAQGNGSSITIGVAGNVRYTLFDERGNIVKTRNESKVEKSYEYSEANRKTKETDGLNNSLKWEFNEKDYGRLSIRNDLFGRTFKYGYNKFGQVVSELGNDKFVLDGYVSPEFYDGLNVDYSYYANGALRSVGKSSNTVGADSRKSTYEYNISGAVVREVNSTLEQSEWSSAGISAATESRFLLDEQARLKEVKAPNGTYHVLWGGAVATARVDYLRYSYDELGGRRRVELDTTSQPGVRTKLDDWYKYDKEGRVLIDEGFFSNGKVLAGKLNGKAKGLVVTYDSAGRRLASEEWGKTVDATEVYKRNEYGYNDKGQLISSSGRDITRRLGEDSSQAHSSVSESVLALSNTYDELGNRKIQNLYSLGVVNASYSYSYRGDGKLIEQLQYSYVNSSQKISQGSYFGEAGMLDAAGNQQAYRVVAYNASTGGVNFKNSYSKVYHLYEDYKEGATTVVSTQPSTAGSTYFVYTGHGDLKAISGSSYSGVKGFVTNANGQVVVRKEANETIQSYIFYNGAALANVGNANVPEIINTLTPVSSEYPGRNPGNYTISQGDTLDRIAQTVWGDSGMWYLIADANGLVPGKDLMPGNTLIIPNVVSSTHNNASTFKPYSADEIVGDNTPVPGPPPPPPPPKKKGKKCGGLASVVMVVVAVVATIYTAGAASAALGASVTATGATAASVGYGAMGFAAVTGGAGALGVGAAVIGGMAGAAASQLAGKSMGVVDGFSWGQVAVGGLTSGITSGLGALAEAGKLGSWAGTAAQAMKDGGQYGAGYAALGTFNYATSQVANRVVGLDTTFRWRDVAASSAGAVIAGAMNGGTSFTSSIIRGQVSAYTSAVLKDKWFGGAKPDYAQVAVDAFGNALADVMISRIKPAAPTMASLDPEVTSRAALLADSGAVINPSQMSTDGLLLDTTTIHPEPDENWLLSLFSFGGDYSGAMRPLFMGGVNSNTDLLSPIRKDFNSGNIVLDVANVAGATLYNIGATALNTAMVPANVTPLVISRLSGREFEQVSGDIQAFTLLAGPVVGFGGRLLTSSASLRKLGRVENTVPRSVAFERVANKFDDDIPVMHQVAPNITSPTGGLTIAASSASGNPAAIVRGFGSLNSRQAAVLDMLPEFGSRALVNKKFGQRDLAALTAETGEEFAMFSSGGRRLVIRGNAESVPITPDIAARLGEQGWRWSSHTHPGFDSTVLRSSLGDRAVLGAMGGERSAILNSFGQRAIFTPLGDSLEGWIPSW